MSPNPATESPNPTTVSPNPATVVTTARHSGNHRQTQWYRVYSSQTQWYRVYSSQTQWYSSQTQWYHSRTQCTTAGLSVPQPDSVYPEVCHGTPPWYGPPHYPGTSPPPITHPCTSRPRCHHRVHHATVKNVNFQEMCAKRVLR